MNNKNRLFRVTSLLLVLCFVSTVMISGTFAKYTSVYAGQDTALIAKWDLDVTDGNLDFGTPSAPATLDLFSHSYNTNIVATAGTEKIIAPGVSGQFVLAVTNNSDVAAEVTFDFAVKDEDGFFGTAGSVPIEYSLTDNWDNAAQVVYTSDESGKFGLLTAALRGDVDVEDAAFDNIAAAGGIASDIVYWRWPFNGDNTADTALGVESAKGEDPDVLGGRTTYILEVTATATQLAPKITVPVDPEG